MRKTDCDVSCFCRRFNGSSIIARVILVSGRIHAAVAVMPFRKQVNHVGVRGRPKGPKKTKSWKRPMVQPTLSISGGLLPKPMPIPTISHLLPPPESKYANFALLTKYQPWVLLAISGKQDKSISRRVQITEKLRTQAQRAYCMGMSQMTPTDENVADDPMNALQSVSDSGKRTDVPNTQIKMSKKRVVAVTMPECETTRHPDVRTVRTVHVLIGGKTTTLYIDVSAIPWLLTWMNDEIQTGGVAAKIPREHAVDGAQDEEILMRWDFQDQDTWTAIITQGAKKGVVRKTRVSKLTQEKWSTVYQGGAIAGCSAALVTECHRGCLSCSRLGGQGMILVNEQICERSPSIINELIIFVCELLSEDCEQLFIPKSELIM